MLTGGGSREEFGVFTFATGMLLVFSELRVTD